MTPSLAEIQNQGPRKEPAIFAYYRDVYDSYEGDKDVIQAGIVAAHESGTDRSGIPSLKDLEALGFSSLGRKPDTTAKAASGELDKKTSYDFGTGVKVLAGSLARVPEHMAAKAITAIQGKSGASAVDLDWGDKFVKWVAGREAKRRKDIHKEHGEKHFIPGIKITDVADLAENFGFSGVSALSGLGVGVPITLAPVLGARPAGWAAGTAAAGAAAYRMAGYEIMQQYLDVMNDEQLEKTGESISKKQEALLKEEFDDKATQYGLWEAIPEAVGQATGLKIISLPLRKMLGKSVATKIVGKIGGLYGAELATETVTEIGQSQTMEDTPLSSDEKPLKWNIEGGVEAVKRVAPQVFLLTTFMGGATAVGHKSYRKHVVDPKRSQVIQDAVAEGQLHILPDETFDQISREASALAKSRPNDQALLGAMLGFKEEANRRNKIDQARQARENSGAMASNEDAITDIGQETNVKRKIKENEELAAQENAQTGAAPTPEISTEMPPIEEGLPIPPGGPTFAETEEIEKRKEERGKTDLEAQNQARINLYEDPEFAARQEQIDRDRDRIQAREQKWRKAVDKAIKNTEKTTNKPEREKVVKNELLPALLKDTPASMGFVKDITPVQIMGLLETGEGKQRLLGVGIEPDWVEGTGEVVPPYAGQEQLPGEQKRVGPPEPGMLPPPGKEEGARPDWVKGTGTPVYPYAGQKQLPSEQKKLPPPEPGLLPPPTEEKGPEGPEQFGTPKGKAIIPPGPAIELPEGILTKEGKPFKNKRVATAQLRKRDLTGTHEVKAVKGGFALMPKPQSPRGETKTEAGIPEVKAKSQGVVAVTGKRGKKTGDRSQKLEEKKSIHDYSNTQVDLPEKAAKAIKDFGKSIPDSEIYIDPKDPSYGREDEPHITVRYGLETIDPKDVAPAFEGMSPVKVTLGKVSIFETDKYDVVKIDIESPGLHEANKRVGETVSLPGETHKDYKPHATIAYVKKGEGKKYIGDASLQGQEITIDNITLSGKDGKFHKIPLTGKPVEKEAIIEDFSTKLRQIKNKEDGQALINSEDYETQKQFLARIIKDKKLTVKSVWDVLPEQLTLEEYTINVNKNELETWVNGTGFDDSPPKFSTEASLKEVYAEAVKEAQAEAAKTKKKNQGVKAVTGKRGQKSGVRSQKSEDRDPIVERALKESVTEIGQLSVDEIKALNQAVKDGILSKGKGGPFPALKTVYAKIGYDFKGEREKAIAKVKTPPVSEIDKNIEVKKTGKEETITTDLTEKEEQSLSLKEQKQYLLAEVDKAIELAPEEKTDEAPDMVRIEIPADGIFTVINTKDALTSFRRSAKSRFPTGKESARITVTSIPASLGQRTDEAIDLYGNAGKAAETIRHQIETLELPNPEHARHEKLASELERRADITDVPEDQKTDKIEAVERKVLAETYRKEESKIMQRKAERREKAIEAIGAHTLFKELAGLIRAHNEYGKIDPDTTESHLEDKDLLNYGGEKYTKEGKRLTKNNGAIKKLQKQMAEDLGLALITVKEGHRDDYYDLGYYWKDIAEAYEPETVEVEGEPETTRIAELPSQRKDEKAPIITIKGNELGEKLTDNEIRQKAKDYYNAELIAKKKEVEHPQLGTIQFRISGRKKTISASADIKKLKIIPALPELIKAGKVMGSEPSIKGFKEANVKAYHRLTVPALLEGQNIEIDLLIKEDDKGRLHYNHQVWDAHKKTPSVYPGVSPEGVEPTRPLDEVSLEGRITPKTEDVKEINPQDLSALEKALKNAGIKIKAKEIAGLLTRVETRDIITTINNARTEDARKELTEKLQGLLDGRSPEDAGPGRGPGYNARDTEGEDYGNEPISKGASSDAGRSSVETPASPPGSAVVSPPKAEETPTEETTPEEEEFYSTGTSKTKLTDSVSLDDVRKIFKGQHVGLDPAGDIWVRTRSGHGVTIKAVEQIDEKKARFGVLYGRQRENGEFITGKYIDGTIELQEDLAGKWTLAHESMHFLEDTGIVSSTDAALIKAQVSRLYKKGEWDPVDKEQVGGPEDRANYIADRLTKEPAGPIGKIMTRIRGWIDRFANLYKRTAEGVVRDIDTGRIFTTSAPKEEAAGKPFIEPQPMYAAEKKPPKSGPVHRGVAAMTGKPVLQKAIKSKFVKHFKEFWEPFSTVPQGDKALIARYKGMGQAAEALQLVEGIHDTLDAFSDDVKRDIFLYMDGQIPAETLPEEARELSQDLRKKTTEIGRMLVDRGIISEEAFNEHKGHYVHYMYAKHILGDDATIGITSTGKLNLTYSIKRKDMTPEQRKAIGLIEDASIAVPIGMGKALTDIAKYDYLKTIAENPDWVWQPSLVEIPGKKGKTAHMGIGKLIEEVDTYEKMMRETPSKETEAQYKALKNALDKALEANENVPEDYTQLPTSKTYGPLAGAFIRTPIAHDLKPIMGSLQDSGKLYRFLAQVEQESMAIFKMGKVALNFPTAFRNVVSNIIQNNLRGRPLAMIPGDIVKGCKSMVAKDKYYKEAFGHGIFKTNWFTTEINDVLDEFKRVQKGTYANILGAVKNVAKYYGKIDDISKHSIFVQMRESGHSVEESVLEAMKWGMDYSLTSRSIKHLRRHIVPFACVDDETEILTKRGWLKYNQVKNGDIALSLNMKTEKTSWQLIQGVFRANYNNNEMLHFKDRHLDMLLTPDHRVVSYRRVQKNKDRKTDINIRLASQLDTHDHIPVAAECIDFPRKKKYSDEFVQIIGWVVTEGHFKRTCAQVCISQNKGQNADNIKALLKKEYPDGRFYIQTIRGKELVFHIHARHGRSIREVLTGGKQLTPDFILSLTKNQVQLLVDAMIAGDGCRNKKTKIGWIFNQKPNQTMDIFQMCLCLLGVSHGRSMTRKTVHSVQRRSGQYYSVKRIKPEKIKYNREIWCPFIPSTNTWFARRNGKVFITHNSYQYKIAPLLAESIKKRPWVIGKFMALPLAAIAATKAHNDLDDEDWEELEKQLPQYIREGQSMMVLPWKTDKGQWQWVNLEYFFPWGNYLSIFRDMSDADMGETVRDLGISNPIIDILRTSVSAVRDQPPKHPFYGTPIYNRLDSAPVKAAKFVEFLAFTWLPSMLGRKGALGYSARAVMGEEDKWGREVTPGQAVARWFGGNIIAVSPGQTRAIARVNIQDLRKELYRITSDPSKSESQKQAAEQAYREKLVEIAESSPTALLPITKEKGEDPIFEELKAMLLAGVDIPGPPPKSLYINTIKYIMSDEQYEKYLNESSAIARRKLKKFMASAVWRRMSDDVKTQKLKGIIRNARKRVRGKIKRLVLMEHKRKQARKAA